MTRNEPAVCNGGMLAYDVSEPLAPKNLGCAWDQDYVHDAQVVIYRGPDEEHHGKEIAFLRFRGADLPRTSRGAAAAARGIFGGHESRRRRGCELGIPWRQDARFAGTAKKRSASSISPTSTPRWS